MNALLDTILSMSSIDHQSPFKRTELLRAIDDRVDLLHIEYGETRSSAVPQRAETYV